MIGSRWGALLALLVSCHSGSPAGGGNGGAVDEGGEPYEEAVDIVVELVGYSDSEGPTFDRSDARWNANNMRAFRFRVLAPANFQGKELFVHHDGPIGSGHPDGFALPGKKYRTSLYPSQFTESPCSALVKLSEIDPKNR